MDFRFDGFIKQGSISKAGARRPSAPTARDFGDNRSKSDRASQSHRDERCGRWPLTRSRSRQTLRCLAAEKLTACWPAFADALRTTRRGGPMAAARCRRFTLGSQPCQRSAAGLPRNSSYRSQYYTGVLEEFWTMHPRIGLPCVQEPSPKRTVIAHALATLLHDCFVRSFRHAQRDRSDPRQITCDCCGRPHETPVNDSAHRTQPWRERPPWPRTGSRSRPKPVVAHATAACVTVAPGTGAGGGRTNRRRSHSRQLPARQRLEAPSGLGGS